MPSLRDYQRWARKGTTTQRGLGWQYVKQGQRLRAAMRDGDLCWRCGQPMYKWEALDQDHLTPRALGGTDGPTVLAHAHCNRSAGARLGNRRRGTTNTWRSSRRW
jgi:5-methylcytosine-specific restriction endonuclease McrA